jgi:hypothetical protein
VQTFDTQSPPEAHPCPAAHLLQAAPPQSTPVSVPFFFVSEQVGTAQFPDVQTWL